MGKGRMDWKESQPQEGNRWTERKDQGKAEGGKARQGQEARGKVKGVGVGVVMGVFVYVCNNLLCAYMYIISVYMYIYTAPWENFLTLNRTRKRMGKNQVKGCGGLHNFHARWLASANCPSCPVKGYYVNHVSSSCTSVKGKYLTPAQRPQNAPGRAKIPGLCGYRAKRKSPVWGVCGLQRQRKIPSRMYRKGMGLGFRWRA